MLEAEVIERDLATDRRQQGVACGRGAVVEVDAMGAVLACAGTRPHRPDTGPDVDAILLERRTDDLGVARVVGRGEAGSGLDDRDRHAESRVNLRELAAGRPAT